MHPLLAGGARPEWLSDARGLESARRGRASARRCLPVRQCARLQHRVLLHIPAIVVALLRVAALVVVVVSSLAPVAVVPGES